MGRRRREEPRAPVPPAKFIEVWQASRSIKEVAQRLHMSKPACRTRAWRYRNEWSIPLRVFGPEPPPETTDWLKMRDHAVELLESEPEALDEATQAAGMAWIDEDEDVAATPVPVPKAAAVHEHPKPPMPPTTPVRNGQQPAQVSPIETLEPQPDKDADPAAHDRWLQKRAEAINRHTSSSHVAHLDRVCDLCKNGRPGVHSPYCRHFVRGYSYLRCDGCDGVVGPANPTYSERLHYCAACLTKRGAARQAGPRAAARQ
jgi:hypothetical protein